MDENLTCPRCAATAAITAAKCPKCAYEFGPNTRQEAAHPPTTGAASANPLPAPFLAPPFETKPDFSQDAPLVPEYGSPYPPRERYAEAQIGLWEIVVSIVLTAILMSVAISVD